MKAETYYNYSYFHTPKTWAERSLIVSDGMGYIADSDFRIDRYTFNNYLACYIHSGTFYIEQYGKTYTLHQGDVGIISLKDPHIYYSDRKDVAHLLWFHFRGAGADGIIQLLKQNQLLPCKYHFPEIEQGFLKNFVLTKSGCKETELAGHMYALLMQILQNAPLDAYEETNIPAELKAAAQLMEEQTGANLTLEQLSAYTNMGKYHFSHMFKKWYGISPMQYYMGKKMEHACMMLKDSSTCIDEIAEKLGYVDTGYFRKVFKSYFGITPSAYRKRL